MCVHTYMYVHIFYKLMDLNIFDVLEFTTTVILTDTQVILSLTGNSIHFSL